MMNRESGFNICKRALFVFTVMVALWSFAAGCGGGAGTETTQDVSAETVKIGRAHV